MPVTRENLRATVEEVVQAQPITDIHTHLYAPPFGELLLWGVDELITYHYLIAETFRKADISYEAYWALSKTEQADLIWQTLFIENSPISESCRGVVTALNDLGLDLSNRDLNEYRQYFAHLTPEEHIDKVFSLANVKEVVMTNDPFDDLERSVWDNGTDFDERFKAALRIDPLLNAYVETGREKLSAGGYNVDEELSDTALAEIRRFLSDWIKKMSPKYMAVSLPPEFAFPEDSARGKILRECVLPVSREYNVPFAMMIGVTRAVNPQLRLAGDGLAKADMRSVENICRENPNNKFFVTVLSRENQHELCVIGRKFPNLMAFGCWWFMNNPSIIEEITRERIELLGLSVIPQHSDARILDQLVYKWKHSKAIITDVLADKYGDLLDSGWRLEREELVRDVAGLLGENFDRFIEG
ncbi:MAG: glucuronate isomerase [Planctomycetota bacterium]|nr:glucuronate isomerase [Planctomycetota bacterium]